MLQLLRNICISVATEEKNTERLTVTWRTSKDFQLRVFDSRYPFVQILNFDLDSTLQSNPDDGRWEGSIRQG